MQSESVSSKDDSKKENLSIESNVVPSKAKDSPKIEQIRPTFQRNIPAVPEKSRELRETAKPVPEKSREIRETAKDLEPISTRSDDVVVRRHQYVNVESITAKRDDQYAKLLNDFKNSLKNFMELNSVSLTEFDPSFD